MRLEAEEEAEEEVKVLVAIWLGNVRRIGRHWR